MALEGTLRDFSLADIFQLIGIQKKTGVLTLKYQGEVVTVSFLNGSVVSADSQRKNLEDRLGTVLVKSGRISDQRLQEALRTQKETRQRLGWILVRSRCISEQDLKEALRLQITQIVYRLFRWRDGEYHFSQEESVEYEREHFIPLSAENVLMEGIRMIDEWPIIERKIPSFDIVFRRTRPDVRPTIVARLEDPSPDLDTTLADGEEAAPADGLHLAKDEAVIYEQIDGRRSVQEVIDRSRMGDFEACRIFYDLLSRNLIAAQSESVPPPRAPARRRSFGPWLEGAGYLALCAAIAASLTSGSPALRSGTPGMLAPADTLAEINDLVTRDRIMRIDEAVQVYHLQKGFYPDDLKELVKGRLLRPTTLRDPWGRSFGFISGTDGYRIIAYDAGGIEKPGRSVARSAPLRPGASRQPAGAPVQERAQRR